MGGTSTYYTGPPITIEDSNINANPANRCARTASETSGEGRRGIDYPWIYPAASVATASVNVA